MHELSLALEMLDASLARAQGRRIHKLIVGLGERSCVSRDALRFAFEVASAATPAAGAQLEFRALAARVHCPRCGEGARVGPRGWRCACGNPDSRVEGGMDFRLQAIEIARTVTKEVG